MEHIKKQAMVAYCDRLTENGAALAVTWSGGSDDGYFSLLLNDESVESPPAMVDAILQMAHRSLGYGSFSGDFSTSGEAAYNRENKSFEGTDTVSFTDPATHECGITIRIPDSLWFDSLYLTYEAGYDGIVHREEVRFMLANGPVTPLHEATERELEAQLKTDWECEIATIDKDKLDSVFEEITIAREEFDLDGDNLVYTFSEIHYNAWEEQTDMVQIPLTD